MYPGRRRLYAAFACVLILNCAVWYYARDIRIEWGNVPAAPGPDSAAFATLGDRQAAFRLYALMIQHIGDTGGHSVALRDYNYDTLKDWFDLLDGLDPHSDFIPLLAAYYFGATQDTSQLDPVIDYLARVGGRTEGQKWWWLGQAIYLARHRQRDNEKALALAHRLALHPKEDRPVWTRQISAIIQADAGEKEAAYTIMIRLLQDRAEDLHPSQVNFIREYICDKLLTEDAAEQHPLCNL